MSHSTNDPQNQLTGVLYVGYTAIVLMMGCLGWVLYQVLIWTIPEARFTFLVPFEVFVAVEAVISTHSMFRIEAFSLSWLSRRIVEWIVLIVLSKLLTYAVLGFKQLAADVLLWDEDFATFFTLEFMVIVIVTAIVWIFTCHFTAQLIKLYGSMENLELEKKGIGLTNRPGIRQGLTTLIFVVGGIMLAVITTLFLAPQILPEPIQRSTVPYWGVMLYFFNGLVLLSIVNLLVLRSRWYLHDIKISPQIWLRWLLFSLLLIGSAAIIANLLPTRYSFGVLGILQTAIEYLIYGITVLQFLIFTPLVWLLNYVIGLFGGKQPRIQPLPTPHTLPPSPAGGPSHTPILDLMRSIFFWTVFFSIILIAFRVYFRQNKEVVDQLRKQPYLQWLFQIWDWFKRQIIGIRKLALDVVSAGRSGLVKARRELIIRLPDAAPIYEMLPPRQKIRLTYLNMIDWLASFGYPRQKQESPAEYASKIVSSFPMSTSDIRLLTDLFVAARYSPSKLSEAQAEAAQNLFMSIKTSVHTAEDKKP